MNLYIRIHKGQPFEHPILENNFRQAFPDIDVNNLPPEFAYFERVLAPPLDVYQHNLRFQYEKGIDGIYRDVWYCDEMTAEEIKEKQDAVKAQWAANNGYPSWVFDETTCSFQPPIPYPNDDKHYVWNEGTLSWDENVIEQ